MNKYFLFLLLSFSNYFLLCSSLNTNLRLLQILYRHGDRTPVDIYPSDPYNITTWDKYGGLGQLTQTGMKQHRQFGQFLRNNYKDFLSTYYNRNQVYARSTDYDRTLMSSYSLLSGLFPPSDYQKFDPELDWQPITVHTTDVKSDMLFHQLPCPKYDALKTQAYSSPEILQLESDYKDILDLVSIKSGYNDTSIENLWETADTLFVEKTYNLTLPAWVTDDVYKKVIYLANEGFYFDYYTTEMARLTAGGVLNDMRTNIKNKISGSSYQLFLYGAHDTFVASLTKLLNISAYINQPPYASAILVELRESADTAGDYYIQIYLKNNTADQPISLLPMTVYGCDQLCPLSKFMNITSDRVVSDFTTDCMMPPVKNKSLTDVTIIITISGLSAICLLIIIIAIVNCRRVMSSEIPHQRL